MPRISTFYGVAIYMYYRDHAPPPFHAIYGQSEATFEISTGDLLDGSLPRTAKKFVAEWAGLHRDELRLNWDLARQARPLNPIAPLD